MTSWGKPELLLRRNADGTLEVITNALDKIRLIEKKLSVIAVVGMHRTGKSYMLTRLVKLSGVTPFEGFAETAASDVTTTGIWVFYLDHPKDKDRGLLLLDTHDLGDPVVGSNQDDRILYLSILLSSNLLYNHSGKVCEPTIDNLQIVSSVINKIALKNSERSVYDHVEGFPRFTLVIRNFHRILKIDGKIVTQNQYMEQKIFSLREDSAETKSDLIVTFRNCFLKRNCFTLGLPAASEHILQTLCKQGDEALDKDFVKEFDELYKNVIVDAPVKTISQADSVTGRRFVLLTEKYVNQVNEVEKHLGDAIESITLSENSVALIEGIWQYNNKMLKSVSPMSSLTTIVTAHVDSAIYGIEKLLSICMLDGADDIFKQFQVIIQGEYVVQMKHAVTSTSNKQESGTQKYDKQGKLEGGKPAAGVQEGGKPAAGVQEGGKQEDGMKAAGKQGGGKQESSKPESGKQEDGKQEGGKLEGGKQESSKPESGKQEDGKPEGGKLEGGKQESSKAKSGEQEGGKPAPGRQEGGKPDSGKQEGVKQEGRKPAGGKQEDGKPEGGKQESSKAESGKQEGGKPAPGRQESGKQEGGKPDSKKQKDGKPDSGKQEGRKPAGGNQEGRKPVGGKQEDGKPEGGKLEGGKPVAGVQEGGKQEGGKQESSKPESGKQEGDKPDSSKQGGKQEGRKPAGGKQDGTPEGGTPEGGTPEGGKQEDGKPEGGKLEGGKPAAGVQEGGKQGGKQEGGKQESSKPESGKQEGGKQEGRKRAGGKQDGTPEGGKLEGGKPAAGAQEVGIPEGCKEESGKPTGCKPISGKRESRIQIDDNHKECGEIESLDKLRDIIASELSKSGKDLNDVSDIINLLNKNKYHERIMHEATKKQNEYFAKNIKARRQKKAEAQITVMKLKKAELRSQKLRDADIKRKKAFIQGKTAGWNKPMLLLSRSDNFTIKINKDAIEEIGKITKPLSVICVVGQYRTGKSFLMNRLAKLSGRRLEIEFDGHCSNEICKKGIWVLYIDHPVDVNKGLLLLDTAGMDDPCLDTSYTYRLLCLSFMLSSNILFNHSGDLDVDASEKLYITSNIIDKIMLKQTEAKRRLFNINFPAFSLIMRNFQSDFLILDGKRVTENEYMEHKLFTARKCDNAIFTFRNNFLRRNSFCLLTPTNTSGKNKQLPFLDDRELDPDFVEDFDVLFNFVIVRATTKTINQAESVNGRSFASLTFECTELVNKMTEFSTIDSDRYSGLSKNTAAVAKGIDEYNIKMHELLSTTSLLEAHIVSAKKGLETFLNNCKSERIHEYFSCFQRKVQMAYAGHIKHTVISTTSTRNDQIEGLRQTLQSTFKQNVLENDEEIGMMNILNDKYHKTTLDELTKDHNEQLGKKIKELKQNEEALQAYYTCLAGDVVLLGGAAVATVAFMPAISTVMAGAAAVGLFSAVRVIRNWFGKKEIPKHHEQCAAQYIRNE